MTSTVTHIQMMRISVSNTCTCMCTIVRVHVHVVATVIHALTNYKKQLLNN